MSTLTQRYIEQVVSHLPEASRPDISRELSALIEDMMDERIEQPANGPGAEAEPAVVAERSALEELGDPSRLAAQYRNSPNHLIGPQLYPVFVQTMRWLLPLVLLLSLSVRLVIYVATEQAPHLGEMIGVAIGRLLTTLLGFAGALTLVFAIIERTVPAQDLDRMGRAGRSWSVADLEAERRQEPGVRGDAIGGLVFLAIMALVPLLPTTFLYVGELNDGGLFLNPNLWNDWLPAYYVILAASAAVEIWALVSGRWTTPQAAVRGAAHAVFWAFLIALLLTQQVVDPAIPNATGSIDWNLWSQRIMAVVLAFVAVWDLATIARRWRQMLPTA